MILLGEFVSPIVGIQNLILEYFTFEGAEEDFGDFGMKIRCMHLLSDGSLAVGFSDGKVSFLNVEEGIHGRVRKFPQDKSMYLFHPNCGSGMILLSDGTLVSSYKKGVICVWNLSKGEPTRQILVKYGEYVRCMVALPGERLVLATNKNSYIKVWDFSKKKQKYRIVNNFGRIGCVTSLPDGRLVTCSDDALVRVWDPSITETKFQALHGHREPILYSCVFPDGSLVTGSGEEIIVWDFTKGGSGKLVSKFQVPSIRFLKALTNGKLAVFSRDKEIKVLHLSQRELLIQTLPNVGHRNNFLEILPDGKVVTGDNNEIKIWDISKSEPEYKILYCPKFVCMVVLPDGKLVSGSRDGTIRMWR